MIAKDIDNPGVVSRAKQAVVQIITLDKQNKLLKAGTGFFISADGDLLTNYHVISGGKFDTCQDSEWGDLFFKEIVSVSSQTVVALLRFYATNVPHLNLGSTTDAVEG
jgi:serine protease Do